MAERGRPVYCTRCGSIVDAGDNFCGACGARVSPNAQDAAPTQQIPTQVYAPPRSSGGNSKLPLILGLGVILLVLIGVGAIVGLALAGSNDSATRTSANEPVADDPQAPEETTTSEPPTERELGVGDSIEAGGIEATLNGVRILPNTDIDQPIENPDNRFLATDLTFENVSEEPVAISSLLEFTLKNEEGYSASQTIHTGQRQLAEGEIAPGEKTSGDIVYEVPPESRGLQLDYSPFARSGTYTWTIGDISDVAEAPEPEDPTQATPEPTTSSPPPSDTEVAVAAEDYYQAVDREDWAYTYANLDAATRALYAEDEWYLKNQFFADTEGLELSTIDVTVEDSASDLEAGVTVYRTFTDGSSIDRYTLFAFEDGSWKHRFTDEENAIFEPGVPYEDFISESSATAASDSSASAESGSSASAAADGDVNCDEVSQEQAQAILESDPSDPNDLDGDGDEIACSG